MSTSRSAQVLCGANSTGLLPYLLPFLHAPRTSTCPNLAARFSTTTRQQKRDNNRMRGVSALRGTGLRKRLSVHDEPLPRPVLDKTQLSVPETDKDHGLWQFFGKERRCMTTPDEENSHGRGWTVQELRNKSFEDLHRLWWVCAKERNRISTNKAERRRLKAGYGEYEARERDGEVKSTMIAIKSCLRERWYAWEDARKLARDDPEVDLSGEGQPYTPASAYEDYDGDQTPVEVEAAQERARLLPDAASPAENAESSRPVASA